MMRVGERRQRQRGAAVNEFAPPWGFGGTKYQLSGASLGARACPLRHWFHVFEEIRGLSTHTRKLLTKERT